MGGFCALIWNVPRSRADRSPPAPTAPRPHSRRFVRARALAELALRVGSVSAHLPPPGRLREERDAVVFMSPPHEEHST